VRGQNCTFWQSFGFDVGSWGFGKVCNVGGVSFFLFCGWEEKNKINSIKFALSCQKAQSVVILILSIPYLSVTSVFLHLLPTFGGMKRSGLRGCEPIPRYGFAKRRMSNNVIIPGFSNGRLLAPVHFIHFYFLQDINNNQV
jgi:hypothetical protein